MLWGLLNSLEKLHLKLSVETFLLAKSVYNLIDKLRHEQPITSSDEAVVVDFVYHNLPSKFKTPEGTLTQQELQEVIESLLRVYLATKAALK